MKNKSALLMQMVIAIIALFTVLPAGYASPLPRLAKPIPHDPYLRLNEVKLSAIRDFRKRFPSITTDKWLKLENGYMAKFNNRGIKQQTFYTKDGIFILSTRYYTEENMPAEVKQAIRQRFDDYSIIAVTEVLYENSSYYRINIKNHDRVKTIQLTGNIATVLEDMENGETKR